MIETQTFLLENTIQAYEWGTRGSEAYIASLLGIDPAPGVPYAELWIGAHPKAPSYVLRNNERIALPEFIAQAPEAILGAVPSAEFQAQLPFLLKVLSAGAPLSIQAHPDKALAAQLHARDPKNYPDANHKPEIAVALTELTAFAGFRPYGEIIETVARYAPLSDAAGSEAAERLMHAAKMNDRTEERASLQFFFTELMRRLQADPAVVLTRAVDRIDALMRAEDDSSEHRTLFLEFRALYPYDIGLLSMLLLNVVHLAHGDGLFLGPGIPHAYIQGSIVECMANSDNVVRAGLTPKFKDVETLCRMLTYECGVPEILHAAPSPGLTEYPSPAPEFSLARRMMNASEVFGSDNRSVLEILLVIGGSVSIAHEGGRQLFKQGDAVLIPAGLARYELTAHSNTELFLASIPRRG